MRVHVFFRAQLRTCAHVCTRYARTHMCTCVYEIPAHVYACVCIERVSSAVCTCMCNSKHRARAIELEQVCKMCVRMRGYVYVCVCACVSGLCCLCLRQTTTRTRQQQRQNNNRDKRQQRRKTTETKYNRDNAAPAAFSLIWQLSPCTALCRTQCCASRLAAGFGRPCARPRSVIGPTPSPESVGQRPMHPPH